MSLKFLNLKSFHPTNKANQRALYIAEETAKENKKKEEEAVKEFEAENESFKEKIQMEDDKQRSLQNLQNFRRKQERIQAERETALLNPDYKPPKKKRRKKKEKEVSKQLSFLYVQPPGLKAALEKEEEEKKSKEAVVDNTVHDEKKQPKSLEEKFPLLKNAPKLRNSSGISQTAGSGSKITYKPFGIEIRNVKCTRCGQFGHTSMERTCPLHDYNPLDAKRRELEDPLSNLNKSNDLQNISSIDDTSKLIPSDDEKVEVDETGLSEKERKKLLKKYEKLKKKLKRKEREDEKDE
eukprot:gene8781-729_t